MSAVGTIVSAGYGFICGAYMPISNFGKGLQKGLSYVPSTYGTSMLKNHMLRGVFEEMKSKGFPGRCSDRHCRFAGLQSGISGTCCKHCRNAGVHGRNHRCIRDHLFDHNGTS